MRFLFAISSSKMDGIYETNSEFPFSKLTLTSPTLVAGGNYFIKFLVNNAPLYIKPPKCSVKGGVVKSGKRYHCDLMFTNENEEFIRWMENLEEHTCKAIYENRTKWFETDMDMSDIENYFASPLKIYKSGKFYLARTNINTRLGKISAKIYDESEADVQPEDINENHKVITILEVQGIKCSARSFQVEIEMKQMMVLNPVDLFEKCILGSGGVSITKQIVDVPPTNVQESQQPVQENLEKIAPNINNQPDLENSNGSLEETNEQCEKDIVIESEPPPIEQKLSTNTPLDMVEVELDLDKMDDIETVQIKARNEVYYELYRQVRSKAKMARKMALDAYLEAKQIKNSYNLDISSDSSSSDESSEDSSDRDTDSDEESAHTNI